MKKRTNHDTRLALIDIIISYSTILYHIIVDSQYVTNVGKIMPKMLYEIYVNYCKHYKFWIRYLTIYKYIY